MVGCGGGGGCRRRRCAASCSWSLSIRAMIPPRGLDREVWGGRVGAGKWDEVDRKRLGHPLLPWRQLSTERSLPASAIATRDPPIRFAEMRLPARAKRATPVSGSLEPEHAEVAVAGDHVVRDQVAVVGTEELDPYPRPRPNARGFRGDVKRVVVDETVIADDGATSQLAVENAGAADRLRARPNRYQPAGAEGRSKRS